jgi:hypothetical protein
VIDKAVTGIDQLNDGNSPLPDTKKAVPGGTAGEGRRTSRKTEFFYAKINAFQPFTRLMVPLLSND